MQVQECEESVVVVKVQDEIADCVDCGLGFWGWVYVAAV